MNRLAPPGMGEMPPGGGVPGVPLAMQTHHMGPPPIPPPGMAAQSQEAQSAAEFTHCELLPPHACMVIMAMLMYLLHCLSLCSMHNLR